LLFSSTGDALPAELRQIRRLFRQKAYAEAKSELSAELPRLKGRSLSEGLLLLAKLETDMERAEELYRRIISSSGARHATTARLELARIYYATGRYESGIGVLSFIPGSARSETRMAAIYLRALCRKQLGETAKARRDLELVDRGDYLYWGYMTLGELDMQEGDIAGAVERYETIAGGHYNPIAGFKLGECYEILGESEKALDVYRTVLRRFPESLEAPKAREKIQMIDYYRRTRKETERQGGDEGGSGTEKSEAGVSGEAYTLQFGAFEERENALKFAEELRDLVDNVRVERAEHDGRTWHRVRSGRYASRDEAERAARRLQNRTGYPSKVLPLR
jgi:tetratricopeptide (TPR) repeat protein